MKAAFEKRRSQKTQDPNCCRSSCGLFATTQPPEEFKFTVRWGRDNRTPLPWRPGFGSSPNPNTTVVCGSSQIRRSRGERTPSRSGVIWSPAVPTYKVGYVPFRGVATCPRWPHHVHVHVRVRAGCSSSHLDVFELSVRRLFTRRPTRLLHGFLPGRIRFETLAVIPFRWVAFLPSTPRGAGSSACFRTVPRRGGAVVSFRTIFGFGTGSKISSNPAKSETFTSLRSNPKFSSSRTARGWQTGGLRRSNGGVVSSIAMRPKPINFTKIYSESIRSTQAVSGRSSSLSCHLVAPYIHVKRDGVQLLLEPCKIRNVHFATFKLKDQLLMYTTHWRIAQ